MDDGSAKGGIVRDEDEVIRCGVEVEATGDCTEHHCCAVGHGFHGVGELIKDFLRRIAHAKDPESVSTGTMVEGEESKRLGFQVEHPERGGGVFGIGVEVGGHGE